MKKHVSPLLSVSSAKTLLIMVMCLIMGHIRAQSVASMPFSQSIGTYTPVSGGTSLTTAPAMYDDNNFTPITLPFTFIYHGMPFSTIGCSANGFAKLGAATNMGYNAITAQANVLSPFNSDLYANSHTPTPGANLSYITSGTAPNRVFTVEWANWGFYSTALNEISFQIKLYETSNSIQFVYGNPNATTTKAMSVGINGATTSDFQTRTTTSNWSASTAASTTSATCSFSASVHPASGLTYTWGPGMPSGYAGADQSLCMGSSATMGGSYTSGTWTALSSNPATTTFADDTLYNTGVTGFTAVGSYGFVWTTAYGADTIIITVSAMTAGPDTTVCQGIDISMAASCVGTWSALSSNPDSTTIINTSDPHTRIIRFNTAGTYGYVWTSGSQTDTAFVTILATPSVTATASSSLYCNSPVQLNAYGAMMYSWTGTGLSGTTISNPTAAGGGTYVVTGYNSNGCSSTASVTISPTGGNTVAGMYFTQSTTTYTPLTGGTSLTNSPTMYDDNSFLPVTLPFTFIYHGTAFYNIGISSNGFATLGATTNTSYSALSSCVNVLSPFNNDLEGNAAASAKLSYTTSGSSPNRIFTIEWKNWGFYSTALNEISFQIKLYESNNNIQFVYSPSTCATTRSVGVGLTGATISDFQTRTSITNWATTSAGGSNSATCAYSAAIHPSSGLTFTWSRGTCNSAYAGPDQTLCGGATATMAALAGSGTWTALSTNPASTTFADDTIYNTTITGFSAVGNYGYVWTTATGVDTTIIHIIGLSAGADQMICQNGYTTLSASCTGTWSALTSNPAALTIANTSDNNSAVSGFTAAGTYGLVWSSGSASDTVYIVVTAIPSIAVTSSSATYCGTPVVLRATGASIYRWSGPGLSNNNLDTTNATPVGTSTYTVVGTTNGCADTASIVVTYNTPLNVSAYDSIISPCSLVQLNSASTSTLMGVSAITYAATSAPGGATYLARNGSALVPQTSGNLDDGGWKSIPLGFHFTYLGNGYDSVNVGTNGVMQFGAYNSSALNTFVFTSGLPSTSSPRNIIAPLASDLLFSYSGSLSYWVAGTAPYRTFHLYYDSVQGFTNRATQTFEAILYEYDGSVDIQVTNANSNSPKTIGLQDLSGTNGTTAPGRNAYTGTLAPEAWHFGPVGNIYTWTAAGGNPTTATISSTSATNPTVSAPLYTGTYSYTVTVSNPSTACTASSTATFTITSGCVWPGDADNNFLVDNNDLLPIGLAFDSTGPARPAASIVWVGQSGSDWADTIPGNINFKYADCNGDGVVDASDTIAISNNYGLIHTKTNGEVKPWRSGIPGITIRYSKDTVLVGDTLITSMVLGDSATTVTNLYGIAFSYHYDPLVMDSTSIQFAYQNSWLGNSSNSINMQRIDLSTGLIKTAVTGIDHTARSGNGVIATMRSIITTDNINGKDLHYYHNVSFISDIQAVDNHGFPVDMNAGIDSNQVGFVPNGINDLQNNTRIRVYPNPAQSNIYISCTAYIKMVNVYDMTGKLISRTQGNDKQSLSLDISAVESGVYMVSVQTNNGNSINKVTVTK